MSRPLHRVSCKVALYSPDGGRVLVMRLLYLGEDARGLPGGHLEEGEVPDEAMRRELIEEVGIDLVDIKKKDFWIHEDGKLILGYIGQLEVASLPTPPDQGREYAEWISLDDVRNDKIDIGSYKDFVLAHQPKVNV